MKKLILSIPFLLFALSIHSQKLYVKTFGDPKSKPIIFLHGGPGYNCATFEGTAAEKLSQKGFFVIVYDRRGEGRSPDSKAKFTFEETCEDINWIYKKYKLKKASLIGHSFGGMVAIKFAEQFPEKINSVILVGAPISLQESFKTIISSSRKIYEEKKDSISLKYIAMLEVMDTTTLEYSSYSFGNAMQNGFYSPKDRSPEADSVFAEFKANPLSSMASQMTMPPTQGFYENEKYTTMDLKNAIRSLVGSGMKIYGLYGKEDGLYSEKQISELGMMIGKQNLLYFDNCSHSVFIDQRELFLNYVSKWVQ